MRGVVDLKAAAGDRLPLLLQHVHTLRGLLRLKVFLSLSLQPPPPAPTHSPHLNCVCKSFIDNARYRLLATHTHTHTQSHTVSHTVAEEFVDSQIERASVFVCGACGVGETKKSKLVRIHRCRMGRILTLLTAHFASHGTSSRVFRCMRNKQQLPDFMSSSNSGPFSSHHPRAQ
jgi:hypothetical protein